MLGSLVEGEFFPPGGDGAYEECVGEASAGMIHLKAFLAVEIAPVIRRNLRHTFAGQLAALGGQE